jgi:hypothetical protein
VAIGEEEHGFLIGIWGGSQHGMVAGGMEAKDHLGFGVVFQCAVVACRWARGRRCRPGWPCGRSTHNPTTGSGCRAQRGALFFAGLIPSPLRGLAQFAMDFPGVAMRPQGVDVWVGDFDFGDFFTGEVGGQAPLPVLVGAFDFAFGLGRGGIAETDVVKLERPAQLGQGVRVVGEKEAVVINIDLQGRPWARKAAGRKSK